MIFHKQNSYFLLLHNNAFCLILKHLSRHALQKLSLSFIQSIKKRIRLPTAKDFDCFSFARQRRTREGEKEKERENSTGKKSFNTWNMKWNACAKYVMR